MGEPAAINDVRENACSRLRRGAPDLHLHSRVLRTAYGRMRAENTTVSCQAGDVTMKQICVVLFWTLLDTKTKHARCCALRTHAA